MHCFNLISSKKQHSALMVDIWIRKKLQRFSVILSYCINMRHKKDLETKGLVSGRCCSLIAALLLCKHSRYWVTNYLPQTNRCLIWLQVFNCTVEIKHCTSLTAAFGSREMCLQVLGQDIAFNTTSVSHSCKYKVLHFSSAGQLLLYNRVKLNIQLSVWMQTESHKQTGVTCGKH